MSAKFFVVTDHSGEIFYRSASEVITRNSSAFDFNEPIPFSVLAQADDADQAQHYVDLLRNRSAV